MLAGKKNMVLRSNVNANNISGFGKMMRRSEKHIYSRSCLFSDFHSRRCSNIFGVGGYGIRGAARLVIGAAIICIHVVKQLRGESGGSVAGFMAV